MNILNTRFLDFRSEDNRKLGLAEQWSDIPIPKFRIGDIVFHPAFDASRRWYVKTLTIGLARTQMVCAKKRPDQIFDNVCVPHRGPADHISARDGSMSAYIEYREDYMCYETGILTGTLYKGDLLYSRRQDAENHVDEKNKVTA